MIVAMEVPLVGDVQASNVIALFALIVSVIALVRPWWLGRTAKISVRHEEYSHGVTGKARHRFVIVNHGPATAKKLAITYLVDGKESPPLKVVMNRPTIAQLHAGDEFHIEYLMAFGQAYVDTVRVAWSDGRLRRQVREFAASVRYV